MTTDINKHFYNLFNITNTGMIFMYEELEVPITQTLFTETEDSSFSINFKYTLIDTDLEKKNSSEILNTVNDILNDGVSIEDFIKSFNNLLRVIQKVSLIWN